MHPLTFRDPDDAENFERKVLSHSPFIGDGASVSARAVVVQDVPASAVVGGNPARVLKMRFAPDLATLRACGQAG